MLGLKVAASLGIYKIQQDGDSAGAAGGGVFAPEVHLVDGCERYQKLFQAARCDGLGQVEVRFLRVLVGRIVGKVGADDKEVLGCEIRLQDFCNLLEDIEVLRADDNGHYRRDFVKGHLHQGQLDLQAVLPVVGVGAESKGLLSPFDELFSNGNINRHLPQGRFGKGIERVDTGGVEAYTMARSKEEDALIAMSLGNLVEGRCRYFPAENVSCVGHDEGLRGNRSGRMHPRAYHGLYLLGGSRIECACDGGLSHFLGFGVTGHGSRVYWGACSKKKHYNTDMKQAQHLFSTLVLTGNRSGQIRPGCTRRWFWLWRGWSGRRGCWSF